jgi:hypothetical protein
VHQQLAAALEARLIMNGGEYVALAISEFRLAPVLGNHHGCERTLGGVTRA